MDHTVLTIGHSTHPLQHFVGLLQRHGVTAVGDVRSKPYSRANPQYNREELKQVLRDHKIVYVFLGVELGARSDDLTCYHRGKVQYDRLAQTSLFKQGIERIRQGLENYRIALMCAEREPLECHRTILVARQLVAAGLDVKHILGDSTLETHEQVLNRLLYKLQLAKHGSFRTREEMVDVAYRIQAEQIAYRVSESPAGNAQLTIGGLQ